MLLFSDVTHPGSYPPPVAFKPLPPVRCVCLPAPAGGVEPDPPLHALTNWRNRPTVTRYLSSRKPLTVAGSASPVAPVPVFVYVRLYVPPATARLVQQLSPPVPAGHVVRPAPLVWQLGGVDVQAPLAQNGVVPLHATAVPHWPFAPHVCTPLPEHSVALSVQPPPSLPPLDPASTPPLELLLLLALPDPPELLPPVEPDSALLLEPEPSPVVESCPPSPVRSPRLPTPATSSQPANA